MLIAITQRTVKEGKGATRDALEQDYVQYYEKFGITLVTIPNVTKLANYLKLKLDGIILSGGNSSKEREQTEKKLLDHAIKHNIPVLGECHGMQTLNSYFGGSPVNIKEETGQDHVAKPHKIVIEDELLSNQAGKKETQVNSFHTNGIIEKNLGKDLKIIARAEDKSIEAFHHVNHPIVGIMWHPERDHSDKELDKLLVNAFLKRELYWE